MHVLARRLGIESTSMRAQVKAQFGAQLEFLSRQQASELIAALNRKAANGNGHASSEVEEPGVTG